MTKFHDKQIYDRQLISLFPTIQLSHDAMCYALHIINRQFYSPEFRPIFREFNKPLSPRIMLPLGALSLRVCASHQHKVPVIKIVLSFYLRESTTS